MSTEEFIPVFSLPLKLLTIFLSQIFLVCVCLSLSSLKIRAEVSMMVTALLKINFFGGIVLENIQASRKKKFFGG